MTGCSSPAAQDGETVVQPALDYPEPMRADHVDSYHGQEVADPYRWMEDEDSSETLAWLDQQNGLFEDYLAGNPMVGHFQSRIESIADGADLQDAYNTERHLLYVACTRARDRLLVEVLVGKLFVNTDPTLWDFK